MTTLLSKSSRRGLGNSIGNYDEAENFIEAVESITANTTEPSVVNTNISTVGAGTLTAAAIVGGLITRSGSTAAFTDTPDVATSIVGALATFVNGVAWELQIVNTTAFPETITTSSGVTLAGNTIIPGLSVGTFLITAVSSTAVTIRGISTASISTKGPVINTADTTVGAATLTAAGIVGGVVTRSGSVAAYTDTTATAAAIIAAMPNATIGQSWTLKIKNTVAFAETITGGSSVTVSGLAIIPPLSVGEFLVTYNGAGTVTMVGIQATALSTLPQEIDNTVSTGTGTMVSGAMEGAQLVTLTASGQAGITLTTRTAAQIQANVPNWQAGQNYRLRIINNNTGTLTTAGGSNVTMTSTIPAGYYADYSVLFATATTITVTQVTVAPTSTSAVTIPVAGVAAGYKVARGVHQQASASDTIVTGLATVVAATASFRDPPTSNQAFVAVTIGDQAGTPAAGSILMKTYKLTAQAADTFSDNTNFYWTAIGT